VTQIAPSLAGRSSSLSRLSSGNDRLDQIFGGGLPANAINLVIGMPGAGKTILAQQYVYANATAELPALYLSTVSEPFEKIIRYGQTLDFFDGAAIGHSVFYDDLSGCLAESGLEGVLLQVGRLIRERRPGILVIDSFKAFGTFASDSRDFRRFIHELAGMLTAMPISTFWVGEYGIDELASAPEFAVADTIISLQSQRTGERHARFLQVLKVRGSGFASGTHTYRLSQEGIDVFPRLADMPLAAGYAIGAERQASGIPVLDEMLTEGYVDGSTTLIVGPTGVGKTLMGLHFIFQGVRNGQPGVIATLAENPTQLERIVNRFGWSLEEEGIELMYRSPVDLYVDEWVYELLATIERTGARRVLIDSLSELEFASPEPVRLREYMYSLSQRCSRVGVSLLITAESRELFRFQTLSEFGISQVSDNVVLLHYLERGLELRRGVTVLKTRASGHETDIREFTITGSGIVLGEKVQRSPARVA
jgi:circadian clock protein KaiC